MLNLTQNYGVSQDTCKEYYTFEACFCKDIPQDFNFSVFNIYIDKKCSPDKPSEYGFAFCADGLFDEEKTKDIDSLLFFTEVPCG